MNDGPGSIPMVRRQFRQPPHLITMTIDERKLSRWLKRKREDRRRDVYWAARHDVWERKWRQREKGRCVQLLIETFGKKRLDLIFGETSDADEIRETIMRHVRQ